MNIRKAELSDYDVIAKLASQLHRIHFLQRSDIYGECENPLENDYFEKLMNDDLVFIFVIEVEELVVAYTILKLIETPKRAAYTERIYLEIDHICVAEDYRGKSIGKNLVRYIKEFAQTQSATLIELSVTEFNKEAIEFYQAIGFKTRSRKMELTVEEID